MNFALQSERIPLFTAVPELFFWALPKLAWTQLRFHRDDHVQDSSDHGLTTVCAHSTMSHPTQSLRNHPLAFALLSASVRSGSTIHSDRCNALAMLLREVSQPFYETYPHEGKGKKDKYDALKDFDWKDKLEVAINTVVTCATQKGWVVPDAVKGLIDTHIEVRDSAARLKNLVDSIGISLEDKKSEGGEDGGRGAPLPDSKVFFPDMSGALLSSHLEYKGVGDTAGRLRIAELEVSAADLASMDADDWKDAFAGPLFSTRVQLKRYLRAQGLLPDPSRPVSSTPSGKTVAEVKEDIRNAMIAGNLELARSLQAGLKHAQGDASGSDLMGSARARARTSLVKWGQRRDKALADCDIDGYVGWKGWTEAAAAMSQDAATDEDFRRFLSVEEQVRRDSAKQASLDAPSRRDAVLDKLKAFLPLDTKEEAGGRIYTSRVKSSSFVLLPPPEDEEAASSGAANVLTLYALDDINSKVEPAHELRKCAKDHARMYPHVRHAVPLGRMGADRWVSICEQKYREITEKYGEYERARLDPPETEVYSLFGAARTMIAKSQSLIDGMENAAVAYGYLSMAACYCAINGKSHYDHFFDRERNQGIVSVLVLNRVRTYTADYVKYMEYRRQINHETQLSKAKYAAIHRQMLSESVVGEKGAVTSEGTASRPKVTTWAPSSYALKLTRHSLDKVGPTMDLVRVMRGYYEAIGAMKPGQPGCPHCGLSHDHKKTVCHFEKFPAFRSKSFREGYRFAVKAGYVPAGEVEEWNGRQGREEADKCDKDGRHALYRQQQHLRKGAAGGPA